LNGFVHGMTAALSVMPGEDAATVRRFFANVYAELKPRGAAEAVLVDQYASIAWKLRRLGSAEQSVAADRFGLDLAKWWEEVDNLRWCKKHQPKLLEDDPLGAEPSRPPSNMAVHELLSEELEKGKGPLLRLMELEMRLRATLTNTLRQLKDLRALHQAREEELETEAETEAPVEWDDDDWRWCQVAEGARGHVRRRSRAKRQAATAPEGDPDVPEEHPDGPHLQTEPTEVPAPAAPVHDTQIAPEPEVVHDPKAACRVADQPSSDAGEPTQPTEDVAPPTTPNSTDENGPPDALSSV
jgi:hypothetical protein